MWAQVQRRIDFYKPLRQGNIKT